MEEVGDVAFSLFYSEEDAPDVFTVYADFGKLPAGREQELCLALMEANLFLVGVQGPIFGISPQTRQVTLAKQCALDRCTAKELQAVVTDMAGKAGDWRKNHFLNLKPAPRGASRGVINGLSISRTSTK